jgi:hypothetical protein
MVARDSFHLIFIPNFFLLFGALFRWSFQFIWFLFLNFFYIWDSFEMNGVNFLKTPVPAPCLSSKESIHCVVCTLSSLSTEHPCNVSCVPFLHLTLLFLDCYMYELFVDNCSYWDKCTDNAFYGRIVGPLPLREVALVWALICTDDTPVSKFQKETKLSTLDAFLQRKMNISLHQKESFKSLYNLGNRTINFETFHESKSEKTTSNMPINFFFFPML